MRFLLAAMTALWLFSTPAKAQIRVGQTTGLTGPAAASVTEINAGAKLLIDSVNAQGGVGGQSIELISLDDKNQVPIALENARKLASDPRVVSLFLTRGTPHAIALLPVLVESEIVLLAPSTGAMALHHPVNPWVFNVRAPYQAEAARVVGHLGLAGLDKVAICYVDDTFGADALQGVQKVFKDAKQVAQVTEAVDKFKPDYSACVKKTLAAKSLGVLLIGTSVSVATGVKAIREAGSAATIATLSNNAATGFIKELGTRARGVIVSQVFPSERSLATPMIAEAARLAAAKGITELTPAMIEGFAASKVLVAGLKRAADGGKPITRASFKRALETIQHLDIGGSEISYSQTDHSGMNFVDLSYISQVGTFRR